MTKKEKPKQEEWEKELDKIIVWDTKEPYLKEWIKNLLAKERHDHEILVNTILDTKNKEIAKARKEGYEEGYKVRSKEEVKILDKETAESIKNGEWEIALKDHDKKIRQEVLSEVENKEKQERLSCPYCVGGSWSGGDEFWNSWKIKHEYHSKK